jgi:hypothetical protein
LSPVFFDIESSGLDGVPIEVGWSYADPETGVIHTESSLIRPVDNWQIVSAWDEAAEVVHGISIERLQAEGTSPVDVASRMNKLLAGRELYSDAPGWDRHWLQMIFTAANLKQNFSAGKAEAHTVIGTMARDRGWSAEECQSVMAKIDMEYPRTHRAADDARHLAALWLCLMRGREVER